VRETGREGKKWKSGGEERTREGERGSREGERCIQRERSQEGKGIDSHSYTVHDI